MSSGMVDGVGRPRYQSPEHLALGSQSLKKGDAEEQGSEEEQGTGHTDWAVRCGHREA